MFLLFSLFLCFSLFFSSCSTGVDLLFVSSGVSHVSSARLFEPRWTYFAYWGLGNTIGSCLTHNRESRQDIDTSVKFSTQGIRYLVSQGRESPIGGKIVELFGALRIRYLDLHLLAFQQRHCELRGETGPNWIVLLHTCLDCVGDFCSDFSGVKTRRLPICYFVSQSLHICGNRHFVTHDQPICGNWNWPL